MTIGDIKEYLGTFDIDVVDDIEVEVCADESGRFDVRRLVYIEEENVLRIFVWAGGGNTF